MCENSQPWITQFLILPEARFRGTMSFDLTLRRRVEFPRWSNKGLKNVFEKLLSGHTQKQRYVIYLNAKYDLMAKGL